MEERELNPAQSLDLIQSMINTAKNKLADDGFFFILWGWLVFTAAIAHYVTIVLGIPKGHYAWLLMIVGAIISVFYGIKRQKQDLRKTYIDTYLGYVWIAFIIAMFITLFFMKFHSMKVTYFFLMLLYGLATFITGGLLNFKPLVYGSLFSFGLAIVSVFVGQKEQLLCIAFAILFSYTIPGHLLRSKYRSEENV